jgi:glycosyltransferase involved in cell wall biosynthesis
LNNTIDGIVFNRKDNNDLKIAFLVNDLHLSGGINVIVKHASRLQEKYGHDVSVVIVGRSGWHEWRYPELRGLRVVHIDDVTGESFDVEVATWWETIFNVGLLNAKSVIWFMQSLEDRFYSSGDPMQLLAQLAFSIKVPVITEASWIRDFLIEQNPFRPVGYALNGIDKEIFTSAQRTDPENAPLRIMIEGSLSAPNKGLGQCLEALKQMEQPHTTVWISPSGFTPDETSVMLKGGPLSFHEMASEYRKSDVLLKLSRVEGMFGPPLEAFHCGATAVVTPVTGAEEYIRSGKNSIVVPWDDIVGTAKVLDRLALDRGELMHLKAGAIETANTWPDWDMATEVFEAEIRRLSSPENAVSSAEVCAQASIIRSIRVPMRLMHENSVSTMRAATTAIEQIAELNRTLGEKTRRIQNLELTREELRWWNNFRRRFVIRVIFKGRSLIKKIFRK